CVILKKYFNVHLVPIIHNAARFACQEAMILGEVEDICHFVNRYIVEHQVGVSDFLHNAIDVISNNESDGNDDFKLEDSNFKKFLKIKDEKLKKKLSIEKINLYFCDTVKMLDGEILPVRDENTNKKYNKM